MNRSSLQSVIVADKKSKTSDEYQTFALAITSDPQYPWYDNVFPPGLPIPKNFDDSDPIKANSERQIRQQYEDINTLAATIDNQFPLKGCIINGDLTGYGHDWQLDIYSKLMGTLQVKVYPGLGNHDYENNVNNSFNNNCASRMVDSICGWIGENRNILNYNIVGYENPSVKTIVGSLAYSFNLGKVHIIQLQNYPTYTRTWSSVFGDIKYIIDQSSQWLENDLATARNRGDMILVNFHIWSDQYKFDDSKDFNDLMIKYGVSAIFVGHEHIKCGLYYNVPNSEIPVFYSGSSSYQHYLIANIDTTNKVMNIKGRYSTSTTFELDGNYIDDSIDWNITLNDNVPNPPLPIPPKTKWFVGFHNAGGFVAKFQLGYQFDGEPVLINTGDVRFGEKRYYDLPESATDIVINGFEYTGFEWKNVFAVNFDSVWDNGLNTCYKLYGTTFDPRWTTENY